MKQLLILIFGCSILLSRCTGCYEPQPIPTPMLTEFQVYGELLYSCNNPRPVANTSIKIGETTFLTDAQGKFAQKVSAYSDYNTLNILTNDGSYSNNCLVQNFSAKTINFGKLYAAKPKQIPVIISYDLTGIDFKKFPTVNVSYSKSGSNRDKAGTTPLEFLKPDTILYSIPLGTGIVLDSISATNFGFNYKFGTDSKVYNFKVSSFCDTVRVRFKL